MIRRVRARSHAQRHTPLDDRRGGDRVAVLPEPGRDRLVVAMILPGDDVEVALEVIGEHRPFFDRGLRIVRCRCEDRQRHGVGAQFIDAEVLPARTEDVAAADAVHSFDRPPPFDQEDLAGRHRIDALDAHEELIDVIGVRHAQDPVVVGVPGGLAQIGDFDVLAGVVRAHVREGDFADGEARRLRGGGRGREERKGKDAGGEEQTSDQGRRA